MALRAETVQGLLDQFGIEPTNDGFVEQALTMRSYINEHPSIESHNQPLATLGDAVILLLVMNELFKGGKRDSGVMTKKAESYVKGTALTEAARKRSLEKLVIWGNGDINKQIWNEGRILGECLEALFGAVFLEGRMNACQVIYDKVLAKRR